MDESTELIPRSDLNQNENTKEIFRSPVSLSRKGLSVTWENLSVAANTSKSGLFKKSKKTYKEIIKNVSGVVQSGKLVAILGASGSGKSTLMSTLANRNQDGLDVEGDIRIGGKRIGKFTKYVSGFVYQNDIFIASLTVMEHLHFAAKLNMSKSTSPKATHNLICDILNELGMLKLANNRIGKSNYGHDKVSLSGGERKRLSIATELLTDPALLFCDEPTTGLDSFTALSVVTNLEYLATHRQKTIICSIHQPNDRIFDLFHEIILLANGQIVFSGTTDDAIHFFKQQGFPYMMQNTADYLIKNIARTSDGGTRTAEKLCVEYKKSLYAKKVDRLIEVENQKQSHDLAYWCNRIDSPNWGQKLLYNTQRNCLNIWRDLATLYMKTFENFVIGLLMGLCMAGTVTRTQDGVQALMGIAYMLVCHNTFPAVLATMEYLPKSLPLYRREYANNTTTPAIYYLSSIVPLLPSFAIDATTITLTVYYLASLDPNFKVILITCIILILTNNASSAFGIFMTVMFEKRQVANAFTIPINQILIIFSGVYIKLSSVPIILRWIRYVSWVTYAMEAFFVAQMTNINVIACSQKSKVPCFESRTEVLARYDFKEEDLFPNIYKILCICLIFHLAAYCLLRYKIRS